jgi:hypothetical protein
MPSRPTVVCILAFWLATLGLVLYRDVWPRLAASGPPPLAVDLSDEASQFVPVQWAVLHNDRRVGRLTTTMTYADADDTFGFTAKYTQVELDVANARLTITELVTTTRVTRAGDLREQAMTGDMKLTVPGVGNLRATAKVTGRNDRGTFVGRCEVASDLGNVSRDLPPVPVARGQALNPLQPVNRIADVHPGRRWVVQEVNPLDEALAALFKDQAGKQGIDLPERQREPLVAEVLSEPQTLARKDGDVVSCWVIEYRSGEARARTWVRVSDGKVLRQEAALMGDRIALEREE